MNDHERFKSECAAEIAVQGNDGKLLALSRQWMDAVNARKYSYHFEWLGRPIIQYPQDIVAIQEIIWGVKPDLIIETGIAHGGSLILSASILELLRVFGAGSGQVVGIDVDIRPHNRAAIAAHPLAHRIHMIEGSSVDARVVAEVRALAARARTVLVFLDSNHTHAHVLGELNAYAPLVTKGSYCVVFDTVIEDMPPDSFPNRPWSRGNNAKTAVSEWLKSHAEFRIDRTFQHKLLVTVAPDGFLQRVG